MDAEPIFLDSNGWVALLNSREALHSHADALWQELGRAGRKIVLTDWIIAETGNSLARTSSRLRFPEAVRRILSHPGVTLIQMLPHLRDSAVRLYADRPDKTWGLVDCASFVVMQEESVAEAFTTDRHFEQAGFKCLLPASAG